MKNRVAQGYCAETKSSKMKKVSYVNRSWDNSLEDHKLTKMAKIAVSKNRASTACQKLCKMYPFYINNSTFITDAVNARHESENLSSNNVRSSLEGQLQKSETDVKPLKVYGTDFFMGFPWYCETSFIKTTSPDHTNHMQLTTPDSKEASDDENHLGSVTKILESDQGTSATQALSRKTETTKAKDPDESLEKQERLSVATRDSTPSLVPSWDSFLTNFIPLTCPKGVRFKDLPSSSVAKDTISREAVMKDTKERVLKEIKPSLNSNEVTLKGASSSTNSKLTNCLHETQPTMGYTRHQIRLFSRENKCKKCQIQNSKLIMPEEPVRNYSINVDSSHDKHTLPFARNSKSMKFTRTPLWVSQRKLSRQ